MTLTGHTQAVRSAVYQPDGKRIVTATGVGERSPRQIEGVSGRDGASLGGGGESQARHGCGGQPGWHADCHGIRPFRTAHRQGVTLWDSVTGTLVGSLPAAVGNVFAVAFSPNGELLAIGDRDGTVRVFRTAIDGCRADLLEGHPTMCLPWHSALMEERSRRHVEMTRQGSGTCATGMLLRSLPCGDDQRAVAFSPDGQRLATAGYGRTAWLWDLADPTSEPVVLRVEWIWFEDSRLHPMVSGWRVSTRKVHLRLERSVRRIGGHALRPRHVRKSDRIQPGWADDSLPPRETGRSRSGTSPWNR